MCRNVSRENNHVFNLYIKDFSIESVFFSGLLRWLQLSSLQPDFSTKHTARVKPSQYIAQHLYKQKRKRNCSSCSSQMSYLSGSKVFRYEAMSVLLTLILVDLLRAKFRHVQCALLITLLHLRKYCRVLQSLWYTILS